jgi:lysophospholipase L1-like esterase
MRVLQTGWCLAGISLAMVLAINLIAGIYYSKTHAAKSHMADTYTGAPWAEEYFEEFTRAGVMEWKSYVYFRRAPFQGNSIHIDKNGLRATWNEERCRDGHRDRRIFVFGGSTVWGSGARDNYTIPSHLSRLLSERGVRGICVTNFGETGYVNTQGLIALMLELRKGNIPNVAIFYDGVNEVFSGFQNGVAGIPQNEANRRTEFNLSNTPMRMLGAITRESSVFRLVKGVTRRLHGQPKTGIAADLPAADRLAEEIADVYWGNVALVQSLARGYGFTPLFYWQPLVFDKHPLSQFEESQAKVGEALLPSSFHRLVRSKVISHNGRQGHAFRDLSGMFENIREPIFYDFAHLGEVGNERVAQHMGADVIEIFKKSIPVHRQ